MAKVPAFSLMSPLELEAVIEFLAERAYAKGDVIYRENDEGSELYVVLEGTALLKETLRDGSVCNSRRLGKGSLFGEISLIEGERRNATAVAESDLRILVLSGLDFFRMVWDYPMLGVKLLRALSNDMISQLSKASRFLDDMARWGETARRRAVSDDLSGLFNRRFLEEAVSARFARGFGEGKKCALLMIDFDRFREINAAYGTIAGDAVIANAGATIERIVGENIIASRLGGDEFAVFLPDAGLKEAKELAVRLQEEIASLFLEFRTGTKARPERVTLTLSIGAASVPEHACTREELFAAADRALYSAKESGRNRVCEAAGE